MCRPLAQSSRAIPGQVTRSAPRAVPQPGPPDVAPESVVLKSTSRAVQLDVFVNDPSGRPVHGLQKGDFFVTDKGLGDESRLRVLSHEEWFFRDDLEQLAYRVGIPAKLNAHSDRKPNGIPG
jgi:hypothetical protein